VIAARADERSVWEIVWRPHLLSRSFHGRDLFAPIAARLAQGIFPSDALEPLAQLDVQLDAADLAQIVYIDHYGNAMTGLRADSAGTDAVLETRGVCIRHAQIFADCDPGEAFWYVNSTGLIEISCNRASAAQRLGLAVGDPVRIGS
jgi:S-adenosylmethionine hydrolase